MTNLAEYHSSANTIASQKYIGPSPHTTSSKTEYAAEHRCRLEVHILHTTSRKTEYTDNTTAGQKYMDPSLHPALKLSTQSTPLQVSSTSLSSHHQP
jgi:hypothetical protein